MSVEPRLSARVVNGIMIVFCVFLSVLLKQAVATQPHIILMVADDLGWNDVGFHGSNQIPTPNIDAMAYSGIILQNYYVNPICTPSRAALMTGKYPIHTGMQHTVLFSMEPRGLPLTEKLLPEYLRDIGYKTHLVGKWHLGFYKKEYLPMQRGFDSHLGFWSGRIDHYDHTACDNGTWGFDFRRDYKVAHNYFGQYVTDIYTDEAVRIINNHDMSHPLFLMVSHSAMHSGNPNDPIRAPYRLEEKYEHIKDPQRRKYAAVLHKLDESVGKVMSALHKRGFLDHSIIVFTTDNGGAPDGFNDNAGSNFPLRGVKNTLWEGGVRGVGVLWSRLIYKHSRIAKQRMHITDWLPTLYRAAGGNMSIFEHIDGFNQWEALTQDLASHRNLLLHNIDDIWGSASITVNQWKLHKGSNYNGAFDGWFGPNGTRNGTYAIDQLYDSITAKTLYALGRMPTKEKVLQLRRNATIRCINQAVTPCLPNLEPCLFDIDMDPCEVKNVALQFPDVVQMMLDLLHDVNKTAIAPTNEPLSEFGDPKHWGRVYTNFGDYSSYDMSPSL